VTPEERQLLETTARSVLKLKEDIFDRVSGIEAVLHALFLAKGRTDIALARLRVMAIYLIGRALALSLEIPLARLAT
jgi:hypothetical protein